MEERKPTTYKIIKSISETRYF